MQTVVSGFAVLMLFAMFPNSPSENAMKSAVVKKVTPVLFAQELEPCVKFWTERLGFHKMVEVPEGNKLGFVILEKNGVELMYQSFASAEKDSAAIRDASRDGHTFLYIEVEDWNATL